MKEQTVRAPSGRLCNHAKRGFFMCNQAVDGNGLDRNVWNLSKAREYDLYQQLIWLADFFLWH